MRKNVDKIRGLVHTEILKRILEPSLMKILIQGPDHAECVLRGYEEAVKEVRESFGHRALNDDEDQSVERSHGISE